MMSPEAADPAVETAPPGEPKRPRWRIADKIGFRLASMLAVALLPLGVVSVVQSMAVMNEARARSEAALTGETMRAAELEVQLIQQARGSAATLALAVVPLLDDPETCTRLVRTINESAEAYSLVGFIQTDGWMRCASTGQAFNFSGNPLFQRIMESPEPLLTVNPQGPISREAVLGVSHPVLDTAGQKRGIVSISLPHNTLISARGAATGTTPPVLMTFNAEGQILTSSVGLENATSLLPRDRALRALAGDQDLAFTALTDAGERVFSVVPIIPGTLYALGSWDSDRASAWVMKALPSAMLPSLMWMACLLVAFLASERLVTRHIRGLRAAITQFAGGSRMVGAKDFDSAPLEIRQLAGAFDRMTDTILHDEAELEDMVHQKEVLLREVHHRVKNNLQLIASIMNMQMRQARSPEAKLLMKSLQDRVMSLATIHRGLYQTTGLTDIRADELLADIVRQVVKLATGPGRRIEVNTTFGDLRLTPDQAVPLSLLLTEALTNAMKYAGSDTGMPRLDVTLRREGATGAVLEVVNTTGHQQAASESMGTGTNLGAQLLAAFAQQAGGNVEVGHEDGLYRLTLTFEMRPLAEAEARNVAEPAAEEDEAGI